MSRRRGCRASRRTNVNKQFVIGRRRGLRGRARRSPCVEHDRPEFRDLHLRSMLVKDSSRESRCTAQAPHTRSPITRTSGSGAARSLPSAVPGFPSSRRTLCQARSLSYLHCGLRKNHPDRDGARNMHASTAAINRPDQAACVRTTPRDGKSPSSAFLPWLCTAPQAGSIGGARAVERETRSSACVDETYAEQCVACAHHRSLPRSRWRSPLRTGAQARCSNAVGCQTWSSP
jgi:hypothetical protein